MKQILDNSKGESAAIPIFLMLVLFIAFGLYGLHIMNNLEKGVKHEVQIEKEARHNGIETVALVVDKNVDKHNTNPRSFNEYELTLYSLKETFHKTVSKKEFDTIPMNTYLQVVVKDDTILLGNKKDKEDTIRFNEGKELNINE